MALVENVGGEEEKDTGFLLSGNLHVMLNTHLTSNVMPGTGMDTSRWVKKVPVIKGKYCMQN